MAPLFQRSISRLLIATIPAVSFAATVQPNAPDRPVLTHQLHELESRGKVDVVLWTRRADGYTLQIVMPRQGRSTPYPRIGAWLVRADGQTIEPASRWDTPDAMKCLNCVGAEASFSFQLDDGAAAVSAVITIDEMPRRAALPRFPD